MKLLKFILIALSLVVSLGKQPNLQAQEGPIRVLIIDDEVQLQQLLVMSLNRLGLTDVDLTESTQGAREKIKIAHSENRPYGIIISDNHLTERANQLLVEIRNDPRNDRTRILYSSGELQTSTTPGTYRALGVDAILPKPYSTAELNTAVLMLVRYIRAENSRPAVGNVDDEECSKIFRRITSSQGG